MSRQEIMQKAAAMSIKQASTAIPPSPLANILIKNGVGLHISPNDVMLAEAEMLKQAAKPWWMNLFGGGARKSKNLTRQATRLGNRAVTRAARAPAAGAGGVTQRAGRQAQQFAADIGEAYRPAKSQAATPVPANPKFKNVYPEHGTTGMSTLGEPAGTISGGTVPPVGTLGSATGEEMSKFLDPSTTRSKLLIGGAAAAAAETARRNLGGQESK